MNLNNHFFCITVNYDRHHIPSLDLINWRKGFLITHDNGKGFGNPFKDDITFLAPIYQCCRLVFVWQVYRHCSYCSMIIDGSQSFITTTYIFMCMVNCNRATWYFRVFAVVSFCFSNNVQSSKLLLISNHETKIHLKHRT